MPSARLVVVTLVAGVTVSMSACNREAPAPPPATAESPDAAPPTERVVGPLSQADAAALATMNDRLKHLRGSFTLKIEEACRKCRRKPRQSRSTRISAPSKTCAKRAGCEARRHLRARGASGHQAPARERVRRPGRQATEGVHPGRETRQV